MPDPNFSPASEFQHSVFNIMSTIMCLEVAQVDEEAQEDLPVVKMNTNINNDMVIDPVHEHEHVHKKLHLTISQDIFSLEKLVAISGTLVFLGLDSACYFEERETESP
jgi:hypothetical protein